MKKQNKKTIQHDQPILKSILDVRNSRGSDASNPDLENSIVVYQISRFEIENCITERIVRDLRAQPNNPLIRCGMDQMIFSVEGYEDDDRELFQIPEFRRYITKVNEQKPAWIYYSALDSHWLPMVALCLVKNATAMTEKKKQRTKMAFLGKDLVEFIEGQFESFFNLCEMAGVLPDDAEKRIHAVCESFGMHPTQGWSECAG